VQLPVTLTYEGFTFDGTCRNLSVGGMFLETSADLSRDALVRLRFELPKIPQTIEVDGRVRWHKAGGLRKGAGIQFLSPKDPRGLRPLHMWALKNFFSALTPKN
jgi:Tfp pilus assembly protein PilZ